MVQHRQLDCARATPTSTPAGRWAQAFILRCQQTPFTLPTAASGLHTPICPSERRSYTHHHSARVRTRTYASMNYDAYATAITDELRSWVHEWLAGIYATWILHDTLRLPLPHPTYPLPPSFPFGAFSTWQAFEWVHEYGGTNQIRHNYAVSFAFHGRTNGPGSSVVWKILSGNIELGVFEIAGPIYDARSQVPFTLGSYIVLEALLASLATRRPIRLGSYIVRLPPRSESDTTSPSAVQFFELRTPEEEVYSTRWGAFDSLNL
ncbi:hypothetical protein MVEN_00654000 [Mycena venus]|uniref:Uncharacterized protein n=1 Tax=Mycena venus TaxID=2733690 RepID=A0A8H6YQJ1_9AGAR|nr:hypothetical protein MVEN_00654000 [Mycena venus]